MLTVANCNITRLLPGFVGLWVVGVEPEHWGSPGVVVMMAQDLMGSGFVTNTYIMGKILALQ